MAVNKPVGDNARKGAVRKRTQLQTKVAGQKVWTKRSKERRRKLTARSLRACAKRNRLPPDGRVDEPIEMKIDKEAASVGGLSLLIGEAFQKLPQRFVAQNPSHGFRPKAVTVKLNPQRSRPPMDLPHPGRRVSVRFGDHIIVP
jgi:hypothetical protein